MFTIIYVFGYLVILQLRSCGVESYAQEGFSGSNGRGGRPQLEPPQSTGRVNFKFIDLSTFHRRLIVDSSQVLLKRIASANKNINLYSGNQQ